MKDDISTPTAEGDSPNEFEREKPGTSDRSRAEAAIEDLRQEAYSAIGEHPIRSFRALLQFSHKGEPLVCDNIAEHPIFSSEVAAYRERKTDGFILVPLVKDGTMVACMCVTMETPRHWELTEIELVQEVADRTWDAVERARVQAELRRSERQAQTLLAELQHRVRNTLPVVRSLARRTFEQSDKVEDALPHFEGRLGAFSRVQSAVTRSVDGNVELKSIVEDELIAVVARDGRHLKIGGPHLCLKARAAEALSLAVHELATNAVKYGAIAAPNGRIRVRWNVESAHLHFEWIESGLDTKPNVTHEGFGHEMLLRSLPYELGADTNIEFTADGMRFTMDLPIDPDTSADAPK